MLIGTKDDCSSKSAEHVVRGSTKLKNSDILKKLQAERLSHSDTVKQEEVMQLAIVFQVVDLLPDMPSKTDQVVVSYITIMI